MRTQGDETEMVPKLERSAVLLRKGLEAFGAMAGEKGWLAEPNSPAVLDQRASHAGVDEADWVAAFDDAQTLARMMLCALLDHVGSVLRLLPEAELFGPMVVGRSALECAARLRWFLAPGISAQERLERHLKLRTDDLLETLSALEGLAAANPLVAGQVDRHRAHRARVISDAVRLGVPICVTKKGVEVVNAKRPSATRMIGELTAERGVPLGAVLFSVWSGLTHSLPWALAQFFEHGDAIDESTRFARASITASDLMTVVRATGMGLDVAGGFAASYFGWRDEGWARWARSWAAEETPTRRA